MLYKTYRFRLVFLYSLPVLFAVGLAPKLYLLQVKERAKWAALADRQHNGKQKIVPQRGKILDRNGHEMAGSILLSAAYVRPAALPEEIEGSGRELVQEIAGIIHQDFDTVKKRIYDNRTERADRQILLARELSDDQADALR